MVGFDFGDFFGCVFGYNCIVVIVVFGVDINDMIGGFYDVEVMFNYYNCIVLIY